MDNKKIAVIIGAGPAGLTAAHELLKTTDIHPIILEESSVIGGISQTVRYHGNRMDIGGHRFFSKSDRVMSWWQDIMPLQGAPSRDDIALGREVALKEGGPDPETTDRVMLVRGRVSRILYLHKFFDYPISMKARTFLNMGFARTMKAGFGYIGSRLRKREENNLEDFMVNRFGGPLYHMFFEKYTAKVWGRHPKDISAAWGAQRIKGLSLTKAVLAALKKPFVKKDLAQKKAETSLIEQFSYPKFGPGQLWETVADDVVKAGAELHMQYKVTGVELKGNRITAVTASTPEGEVRVTGDYFLSSMPVRDLVAAMGDNVSGDVREIAKELPYRDFITVGLLCNRLKIENTTKIKTVNNIVPDTWIYVQEDEVKLGRLQIFNNWSPYLVGDPSKVWIGLEYFCVEGDSMWEMPDHEFIAMAVDEVAKIGVVDPEDVLDSVRVRIKKAYPAYFGSYERFDTVREALDTVQNLWCIGRNGQHRYNNMDHSMLTAFAAAEAIRTGNNDRASIWSVNAEEEYHEQKTK